MQDEVSRYERMKESQEGFSEALQFKNEERILVPPLKKTLLNKLLCMRYMVGDDLIYNSRRIAFGPSIHMEDRRNALLLAAHQALALAKKDHNPAAPPPVQNHSSSNHPSRAHDDVYVLGGASAHSEAHAPHAAAGGGVAGSSTPVHASTSANHQQQHLRGASTVTFAPASSGAGAGAAGGVRSGKQGPAGAGASEELFGIMPSSSSSAHASGPVQRRPPSSHLTAIHATHANHNANLAHNSITDNRAEEYEDEFR